MMLGQVDTHMQNEFLLSHAIKKQVKINHLIIELNLIFDIELNLIKLLGKIIKENLSNLGIATRIYT